MIRLFLEALDVPPPGWSGRRRFIAGQLVRMAVEGLVFVLLMVAFVALIVMVAAATDSLPVNL